MNETGRPVGLIPFAPHYRGSGVLLHSKRLFSYIRQTIRTRCEKTFWEKLEVVPATLHNDAGIIGPATLAIESEFRHSA